MAPYLAESDETTLNSPDLAVNPISKAIASSVKVKRQVDEEGGKTTAKVFLYIDNELRKG
jgi:hypothetical protein